MNVGTALGLCFSLVASVGIESYSMTCTLTVYVSGNFASSSGDYGHAFVSIKNNSMISVSAGYMSLPPLGQATLGTWGNMQDHLGVWYNLESLLASYFSTNVAISTTFDLASLASVNSYSINHNDTWTYLDNCSTFAAGVWNTVSCDTLDPGLINTPSNLYSSVISKSYYVTNATIPNNSNVGYYANTYFVPYYGSGPSNIVEVMEA